MQAVVDIPGDPVRVPAWLRALAVFGVAWNIYGAYQFAGSFGQNPESMMAMGMTAEQAAVYLGLPAWISAVFAVGVFGGLAGSVALLARRRVATPLLLVSLVGYVLLFAGDAYHGVFASIPVQLAILGFVVLVAGALLWASRAATRRGLLA